MRLTNAYRLPQPIYDAVKNDPYSKGDADYSVTGLLKPAQISALEEKHSDAIVEDVVDRIYSLLGQVVHGILERAESTAIAEERLYMELMGKRISGQMDRIVYHEGLLQDYKFISVKKVQNGAPEEFIQQLNFYAELMQRNDYYVDQLELVCILRDWQRYRAKSDESYPTHQVMVIQVPRWPRQKVIDSMVERLRVHEQAKAALANGLALPECTDEERWLSPSGWAIRRPEGKRAFAKGSSDEALAVLQASGGVPAGSVIIRSAPRYRRCEEFCRVAEFCEQWKRTRG